MKKYLPILLIFLILSISTASAEVNTTGPLSMGKYTSTSTLYLEFAIGLVAFLISIFLTLFNDDLSTISAFVAVILDFFVVLILYYGSLRYIDGTLTTTNNLGVVDVLRDGAMSIFLFYAGLIVLVISVIQCYIMYKTLTYKEPKEDKYYWEE